jgi:hypothetical protein
LVPDREGHAQRRRRAETTVSRKVQSTGAPSHVSAGQSLTTQKERSDGALEGLRQKMGEYNCDAGAEEGKSWFFIGQEIASNLPPFITPSLDHGRRRA